MADPKRVEAGNGIGNITQLLDLLGGQKGTTTTTGDTTALQDTLGQLKNNDPTALLQSIFSQAGGQIPGLQAARSNAVGARTGGNSVAGTAIDKLLQDTVLKAQQQIAQQTLANQQLQVQAGGAIAANNQTKQQQSGTDLGKAGTILGIGQGLSKLIGSPMGQKVVQKGKGLFDQLTGSGDTAAPLLDTSQLDLGSQQILDGPSSFQDFSGLDPSLLDGAGTLFDSTPDVNLEDFGFADGGLVGRDDKTLVRRHLEEAENAADPDRSAAIKAANDKQKAQKDSNSKLSEYDRGSKMVDQKTGIRFADGGSVDVKAAGGRRSSAPSYTPQQVIKSQANQGGGIDLNPRFSQELTNPGSGGMEGNTVGQSDQGLSLGSVASAIGHAGLAMANPAAFVAMMMDNAMQEQSGKANPVGFQTGLAVATANPVGIAKGLVGLIQAMQTPQAQTPSGEPTVGEEGFGSLGLATGINNDNGYSGLSAAVGAGEGTGIGAAGANPGDSSASGDYATGGEVDGPGTGTSDSIQANLSDGEYVIPADVVAHLGVNFFDNLRAHFHTPASQKWGPNSPEDSDSKNGVDDAGETRD